jgi:two-component system cell cycle sensor histidine kinase/response regulator CckA
MGFCVWKFLKMRYQVKMKNIFKFYIFLLYTVIFTTTLSADSPRKIRAGIYENEPKIFTEKGKPAGFWVELLNYVASKENWKIEWVHGAWDECLQRLQDGQIDMMPDVAYTKERAEKYDFQNETIFISWARIYVPLDSKIESFPDLDNKKIAVLKGSVNYKGKEGIKELTENFGINCIFIETTDYDDVFKLVEKEKVDAGVVNKNFGNIKEKKYKVKRTGIVFQPADLRFALSKKSKLTPLLISRIDYNIDHLKADKNSNYYSLIEKYFEGPITEKFSIPGWLKSITCIIVGLLLFLVLVSLASRYQVKRKTAQLKESEERYRTLFENSAEGILVADIESKQLLYANPALCRMLDYSKEELTQMSISDIHPKDSLEYVLSEFDAQAKENKELTLSIPCSRKDGKIIYTDIVTSKMDIDGKICNVGFFTDITKRKKAEEEKENLNQQLLQAQKMESVGRLAGTIAHDFNNLLTAIIGYGYLLYDELKSGDPKKTMMEEIINAANQAANLTGQLLAFSRKKPVKLEVFDLNSIITDTEGMIHRLIGEDTEFSNNLEKGLRNIKGDFTQIEQVILNLIVNARDAMPKGGKLTLETKNITTRDKETHKIPFSRKGDFVSLSVTDTGVGIDKKTIPKIFDPFFTTKKSGTGLGLSVVREIVEKHDGWVNVESSSGKGTTFRIYLPVSHEEKTKKTKEVVPIADLQGNGELIVVLEDEEITRNFIVRVLKENGYSVLEAENIEEAAEIFEENKEQIKMVFSDVVLPDGSGLDFAEELIAKDENTKILLSSGYIDEKAELSHIAQRKFKFLEKPYDVPKLLTEIKRTLTQSSLPVK